MLNSPISINHNILLILFNEFQKNDLEDLA